MKIVFVANHKKWGGLANNGGTKTIIQAAETMEGMGHTVDIVASVDRFTWFKHKPIICKIPKDADAVIAVSVSEIDTALEHSKNAFWWMRGLETWRMPEEKIIKKASKIRTIVNSSWLLKKVPSAKLCYAGLDVNLWKDYGQRKHPFIVGCLGESKHKTKRYDLCKEIESKTGYNFVYLGNRPYSNLHGEDLVRFYNMCHVWLAPTELEGFHNVPAEASLCGCLVLCNKRDSNGMGDYATDDTAERYDTTEELLARLKEPDYSKTPRMQAVIKNKIGSKETNMKNFIKIIGG